MSTKTEAPYVGELIRKEIKDQKVTNGFVIRYFLENGIEMSDARFSNKIYGQRDQFTPEEVAICNKALRTNF
jgi:hypothetical protein